MDDLRIEEKIVVLIKDCLLETQASNLNLDTDLLSNDLGFNSISFISLLVKFEKEFNIDLDDELDDISKIRTPRLLSQAVSHKISGER